MTTQTFEGFLLTRNWRDTQQGVELEFWFATPEGPLCARVHGERSVFFLPRDEVGRAGEVLGEVPGLEIRPVKLRSFTMAPLAAFYFSRHRAARPANSSRAGPPE